MLTRDVPKGLRRFHSQLVDATKFVPLRFFYIQHFDSSHSIHLKCPLHSEITSDKERPLGGFDQKVFRIEKRELILPSRQRADRDSLIIFLRPLRRTFNSERIFRNVEKETEQKSAPTNLVCAVK